MVALSPMLVAIVSRAKVYLASEIQELLSEGGGKFELFGYLEFAGMKRNL